MSRVRRISQSGVSMLALALLLALSATELDAQSGPRVQALIRDGQAAIESGDFSRAAADFEQARQLAPENLQADRGLLLSYLQGGQLAQAVRFGGDSVVRWPRDAELRHWLGLAYFKMRQNSPARDELQQAEALDAGNADIHFDLALVDLDENQYDPAAKQLEKAIKLKPGNPLAHVLLGRAYQNTNRTLQGIEQFKIALRINPKLPLGHYHLGFAYASLGRSQDAIVEYQKEIARNPEDANVLHQLGHY